MKINGVVVGLLAAATGIFLLMRKSKTVSLSVEQQRNYLAEWAAGISTEYKTAFMSVLQVMTDEEVTILYTVVKDYLLTDTEIPEGEFKQKALAIFQKYQIGT